MALRVTSVTKFIDHLISNLQEMIGEGKWNALSQSQVWAGAEHNQGSEVNKKVISVNILIISALLAESANSGTRATQHKASYKQGEFLNVSSLSITVI